MIIKVTTTTTRGVNRAGITSVCGRHEVASEEFTWTKWIHVFLRLREEVRPRSTSQSNLSATAAQIVRQPQTRQLIAQNRSWKRCGKISSCTRRKSPSALTLQTEGGHFGMNAFLTAIRATMDGFWGEAGFGLNLLDLFKWINCEEYREREIRNKKLGICEYRIDILTE